MEKYRYSPLSNDDSIRLAIIQPGKFHDDIILGLVESAFTTKTPPRYEALSYAWGSAEDLRPVQVFGLCDCPISAQTYPESPSQQYPSLDRECYRELSLSHSSVLGHHEGYKQRCKVIFVTQNLDIALRHLRHSKTPRVIWIDALCIDQDNDVEKGSQVARMGEIFRLADRVIAWLGPEENDSDRAMELMGYFGSMVDMDWTYYEMKPSANCDDHQLANVYAPLPLQNGDLNLICHLLSRPWYGRLWVRQEIYLANSQAVVMCGHKTVRWETFRSAMAFLYRKPLPGRGLGVPLVEVCHALRGFIHQRKKISLLSLRVSFDATECRDPRDRIYGVLSLLKEKDDLLCGQADYTIPWCELYQNVIMRFVRRTATHCHLQLCELREDRSCPSWVPDWSTASKYTRSSLLNGPAFASAQIASRHDLSEPGVMKVMGVSKATINDAEQLSSLWGLSDKELFRVLRDLVRRNNHNMAMLERYARTFIWDEHKESRIPNREIRPSLDDARRIVLDIVAEKEYGPEDSSPETPLGKFCETARLRMSRRKFMWGTDGYIGIGPSQATVGDEVCVILGCDAPMLLRPCGDGKFLVVGECFVQGLCQGEAILGPLPHNIRMVRTRLGGDGGLALAIRDMSTGRVSFEDPRLESLPVDLEDFRESLLESPHTLLEVDPTILRERGVDLKYFPLI
ncbi:heterokaryon incompatibility protein-domain-containing protein [Xylariaceae sp. FL0662B]|nr:heterokaryon incompatibility protein-domain-containing protein [Xylariaceae sp. FL0662B]